MPEVQIFPDRELATQSGVTVDAIAQTVQAAIGGTVQGKYTNKDRRYDVRLRLEGGQRVDPQDILNLDVRTDYNELIPISSVIKTQTRRYLPDHRPHLARALHFHLRQHRTGQVPSCRT